MHHPDIISKLEELTRELHRLGLWAVHPPAWVCHYDAFQAADAGKDFIGWLQFVYLPNKKYSRPLVESNYIAPHAAKHLGNGADSGQLLQLLIELDALS